MAALIPLAEARRIVLHSVRALPSERVALADAAGRVLAEPVRAAADVPPFANSAMDGYAVVAGPGGRRLRIVDESRAGHPATAATGPGEAVVISTGAAMPAGADAVVPLEDAQRDGSTVLVATAAAPGRNVRAPGEDLRGGSEVLSAGRRLDAAAVGVAAAAGVGHLECTRRARVAVLATGDELVAAGAPLGPGQIHETNTLTLAALARREGADVVQILRVADTADATAAAVRDALAATDLVMLSGGVSVGPHDHVRTALGAANVQERFWRVALRPGKPVWFGVHGLQLALGLPGNPVSAMVGFELFAAPALRGLQGAPALPPRTSARLAVSVRRIPGREQAVRVALRETADGPEATPTGPQGSHVLSSMLGADALAFVAPGEGELAAGAAVEIERLPSGC